MKLSEEEIIFMIEVDSAIAGRLFVAEDDSLLDKNIQKGLADKGLISITPADGVSGNYIEMTEVGQDALENNE